MADEVWFASKVDGWVAALLCVPPLSALFVLAAGSVRGLGPVAVVPAALVALIYGGLLFPVRYGVGREELIVRFGLVRSRVKLAAIKTVRPTSSVLSAPALSLDRLEVRWGEGAFDKTLVSPDDKERFLAVLAERGGLARDGEVLTR